MHFSQVTESPLRLIFLLIFSNTLVTTVLSTHWINLNVWHDELAQSDQQQSSSSSIMTNSNATATSAMSSSPGGRQGSTLPACHELDGLTEGQIKLCLLFSDHMRPVIQGAKLGISECRWQFRHHHWNCTVLPETSTTSSSSSSSPVVPSRVLRENKVVTVNSQKNNPSSSSRRRNIRNKQDDSTNTNNNNTQSLFKGRGVVSGYDDADRNSSKERLSLPNKESQLTSPSDEYFVVNSSNPPKPRKKGKNKNQNSRGNSNTAHHHHQYQPAPQQQYSSSSSSSGSLVEFHDATEDGIDDEGDSRNSFVVSLGSSPPQSNKKSNQNGNQILQLQQNLHHLRPYKREEKADWNSILTRGTKEVAFAQAIWSAAVTESVARSCREGSISSCGCGKTPRPSDLKAEWRWGGCGDNLQYGYKFAQSFVDIREQENIPTDKKAKVRALVNLHNNEAGRRAVLKKTKIACKCHGVSGSCALVTCWHQIPSFREIGDHLKERYQRATQVKLNKRGRLQVKKSGVPVPSVVDLVYIESSPNYCVQNETLGVSGTTGRVCNRTVSSPNSCKNLCCNRGYTTVVAKSDHRCNCKFIWCCQVVCEECRSVQKYDVCK